MLWSTKQANMCLARSHAFWTAKANKNATYASQQVNYCNGHCSSPPRGSPIPTSFQCFVDVVLWIVAMSCYLNKARDLLIWVGIHFVFGWLMLGIPILTDMVLVMAKKKNSFYTGKRLINFDFIAPPKTY